MIQKRSSKSSNFGQRIFLPLPNSSEFGFRKFLQPSVLTSLANDELEDTERRIIAKEPGEWSVCVAVVGQRKNGIDSALEFGRNTFFPCPIVRLTWGSGGVRQTIDFSAGQSLTVPGQTVKVEAYWQQLPEQVADEWNAGGTPLSASLEGLYLQATLQRSVGTRDAKLTLMTMLGNPATVNQQNNRTFVPPYAVGYRLHRAAPALGLPPAPAIWGANAFVGVSGEAPQDLLDVVSGATEVQRLIGNAWWRALPMGAVSVVANVDAGVQRVRGFAEYTLQI